MSHTYTLTQNDRIVWRAPIAHEHRETAKIEAQIAREYYRMTTGVRVEYQLQELVR